ncbi:Smr domain-containing protein [Hypnocyclicus thermotrophus]|uniref:Smr domain-containing protein n=1 Tax=Hypnocyclicus thermotrophus TaxID=1627895 RepID=A0AA46DXD4_9FUSO|nr:Smr/MutS family protein [Hypnocyclicus thermotrophus]TDT67415.1 Smr domain-containing protein [Hypnocyclicus thermotrophus]
MKVIDLHGLTVVQAEEIFIREYNNNLNKTIKIIHGYGSSGSGGKIRKNIRKLLEKNKEYFNYKKGEIIDGNRGYTIVYPKKRIPEKIDSLKIEILKYCMVPKTKDKIAGHFRKYKPEKILKAIKYLESNDLLEIIQKGKYKCYVKK